MIRTVGMRAADLAGIEAATATWRPGAVVVTGLAGGCAPDGRPGEVVVGAPVGPTRSGEWLLPDPRLRQRAVDTLEALRLPYRVGTLMTVSDVTGSREAKGALWASQQALAVDMESAIVMAWAGRSGLPALAVRAVADGAEDALPPALAEVLTAEGRVRPAALLRWGRTPSLGGAAWQAWRRSRRALDHLARFLTAFEP